MMSWNTFRSLMGDIQNDIHETAKQKGWWDKPREEGTIFALFHSELSEGFEAVRAGNPPSEKIPDFSQVEEELADVIIRILDYAAWANLDIAGAIIAKMEYNTGRSYRHGGKKY